MTTGSLSLSLFAAAEAIGSVSLREEKDLCLVFRAKSASLCSEVQWAKREDREEGSHTASRRMAEMQMSVKFV